MVSNISFRCVVPEFSLNKNSLLDSQKRVFIFNSIHFLLVVLQFLQVFQQIRFEAPHRVL